jgi:hypothetical protein
VDLTPPPNINTLVDLRFEDGREFPSRVEDAEGETLILAAPFDAGVEPPEPGQEFHLRWSAGARGRYLAPIRLVGLSRQPLRVWHVKVSGPIRIEQRRRFVRGGGGELIRLRPAPPAVGPELSGRIVDLSEGGLRCWVGHADLTVGDSVSVRVGLDEEVIELTGTVLRMSVKDDGKGLDVVVVFDLDDGLAALIRRYVMSQQLIARRTAVEATS